MTVVMVSVVVVFQSTLPVGGATSRIYTCILIRVISIHAPRGGSDTSPRRRGYGQPHFNPRSPWGERRACAAGPARAKKFQSTLPVGGATSRMLQSIAYLVISIHAPRGGSDGSMPANICCTRNINPRSPWGERQGRAFSFLNCSYFNPRSPWGERLRIAGPERSCRQFQSTLPVGGATGRCLIQDKQQRISIHAPRGGSDMGAGVFDRD